MKTPLKSYPARWQGDVLLACRKCQKKLRKNADLKELAQLRKTVRKRKTELGLNVLDVPCMKLCPKGAVAICVPSVAPDRLMLIRREEDLDCFRPAAFLEGAPAV